LDCNTHCRDAPRAKLDISVIVVTMCSEWLAILDAALAPLQHEPNTYNQLQLSANMKANLKNQLKQAVKDGSGDIGVDVSKHATNLPWIAEHTSSLEWVTCVFAVHEVVCLCYVTQ